MTGYTTIAPYQGMILRWQYTLENVAAEMLKRSSESDWDSEHESKTELMQILKTENKSLSWTRTSSCLNIACVMLHDKRGLKVLQYLDANTVAGFHNMKQALRTNSMKKRSVKGEMLEKKKRQSRQKMLPFLLWQEIRSNSTFQSTFPWLACNPYLP